MQHQRFHGNVCCHVLKDWKVWLFPPCYVFMLHNQHPFSGDATSRRRSKAPCTRLNVLQYRRFFTQEMYVRDVVVLDLGLFKPQDLPHLPIFSNQITKIPGPQSEIQQPGLFSRPFVYFHDALSRFKRMPIAWYAGGSLASYLYSDLSKCVWIRFQVHTEMFP